MHQIGKDRFGVAGWRMKFSRYKYTAIDLLFNDRFPQNFNTITCWRLSQVNYAGESRKRLPNFPTTRFPLKIIPIRRNSMTKYAKIFRNWLISAASICKWAGPAPSRRWLLSLFCSTERTIGLRNFTAKWPNCSAQSPMSNRPTCPSLSRSPNISTQFDCLIMF